MRALPSVHSPPTPSKINAVFDDIPLVETVLPAVVELNVTGILDHVVVADSSMEPRTLSVGPAPCANVTVPADTVMSRQAKAPAMPTV